MAIGEDVLNEIRARLRLADVIGRRIRLTRHGREYLGLCPFHKEKTPSFTVNEQKGFYHCFGCGAHGSLFDFVMATEGIDFRAAVEKLAAEAGVALLPESPERRAAEDRRKSLFAVLEAACRAFERRLAGPEGEAARAYLKRRAVAPEQQQRFRLGFAAAGESLRGELAAAGFPESLMLEAGLIIRPEDSSRRPYDRFRGRLMFPIADHRGRIVGFGGRLLGPGEPKYLNSPETPLFHKGACLYGHHLAREAALASGRVIAVEGYMDVIGLHAAGFGEAVAPLGTALTPEQVQLMWRLAPTLILCFDPDAAGQRAAARAIDRVLPLLRPGFDLKIAMLRTDTGEDPDEAARRYPRQFLVEAFAQAMPLSEVIFALESGGRLPRSPEAAAALEARLARRAAAITDAELRRHFRLAFRERLRQAQRPAHRPTARAPSAPPLTRAAAPAPPLPPAARWVEAEKHLLAYLLAHPADFSRYEEAVGTLVFRDPGYEALRQALIRLLSEGAANGGGTLCAQLADAGLDEPLGRILADPAVRLASALAPEAPAEARAAFVEAQLSLLRRRALTEEAASDAGAESPSDWTVAWRRRRDLIRARLDEGEP